jgi:hypothetical protein
MEAEINTGVAIWSKKRDFTHIDLIKTEQSYVMYGTTTKSSFCRGQMCPPILEVKRWEGRKERKNFEPITSCLF